MIEVEVPNWSSPSTVASTSICGTTTFDVEEIGTDSTSDYGLRFRFLTAALLSNTQCSISVMGMTNPNSLLPANSASIKHRVISTSAGMVKQTIKTT